MNIETLAKLHCRRIQCNTYNCLLYVNKSNTILWTRTTNKLDYFVNDQKIKDFLADQFENVFFKNFTTFAEWVLGEFDFEKELGENIFGFNDDGVNDTNTNKSYLYHELRQIADKERPLKIYSWGKRHRKKLAFITHANFNACILSGKAKGLDLRKLNGTFEILQKSVETSKNFDTFMRQMVTKIEHDDALVIGINCTAGRHRSVSCAEILRKRLYPEAKVVHLELGK